MALHTLDDEEETVHIPNSRPPSWMSPTSVIDVRVIQSLDRIESLLRSIRNTVAFTAGFVVVTLIIVFL
jgi:hypothetical protein